VLLDHPVNRGEAEARAPRVALGGEEGLEDLVSDLCGHTAAGVGDGEHRVRPLGGSRVAAGVGGVEPEHHALVIDGSVNVCSRK